MPGGLSPAAAPHGRRVARVLAGAVVAAGVLVLALPHALADWQLVPDAIEYYAIAHSFASGAGFVDPIAYSHYLEPHYPLPGAAARPPLWPLVLALPLRLGAAIEDVQVLHVVAAALVGAGVFATAARFASTPAALAAAIGFAWSFGWSSLARLVLTETASVALVLALVALAPRALRSVRAAAAFGVLAFAAWLTRPNLALAVPALALAGAGVDGLRASARSRPLWTAALVSLGFVAAFWALHVAATGLAPYAHHGVLLETLGAEDARFYQREYVGPLRYFAAHAGEVSALLRWNARAIARTLFLEPGWHYVGWLALPGLARALVARGPGAAARRFIAWLALCQLPPTLAVPGSVEPLRLSLFFALAGWLLAAELFDAVTRALAARVEGPGRGFAARLRAAPVALVLAVFAGSPSAAYQLGVAREAWRSYAARGTRARNAAFVSAAAICPTLPRGALVASPDPWAIALWCGNPGLWLPVDLDSAELAERYLAEQAPNAVVLDGDPRYTMLRRSPRLAPLGLAAAGWTGYRVVGPEPPPPAWRPPA
ncbi:MAG TPA: hypothetical protein VHQ66_10620, partial [Myxococcota bacterium]|nr:hypothetical protein [Myxococcota bacterium]